MHDIDLSDYNCHIESIQTEVNTMGNNPSGLSNNLGQTGAKVTFVMSIPFCSIEDSANSEAGFEKLLGDLKVLSKARNSSHPGVKEQYEKLLTIMALNGDVS